MDRMDRRVLMYGTVGAFTRKTFALNGNGLVSRRSRSSACRNVDMWRPIVAFQRFSRPLAFQSLSEC